MPERTLILFRHAKSDQTSTGADIDRPLNPRGRRQAQEAGQWMAENIDGIDLAVVSPAIRAQTTWDLASEELDQQPQARVDERVYGGSVLEVVRDLPDDAGTVVLVGHNPAMEELASLLTNTSVPMPTSAIAVLESDAAWSSAGASWAIASVRRHRST